MHSPRIFNIRAKLLALIAVAVLLAQMIAAALSVWQEAERYGAQKKEILVATAQVLAAASARAVAEADGRGAYAAIRATGRIQGLSYVEITSQSGETLANL